MAWTCLRRACVTLLQRWPCKCIIGPKHTHSASTAVHACLSVCLVVQEGGGPFRRGPLQLHMHLPRALPGGRCAQQEAAR